MEGNQQLRIEGVKVVPLRQIPDERGCIHKMLSRADPHFTEFGEIYFSTIYPGAIKGFHLHKKMTLSYCCIVGNVKIVLHDMRPGSKTEGATEELFVGEKNYCLVQIPPGVANAHTPTGAEKAIVANCADIPHDPTQTVRISPFDEKIGYMWGIKHS